MGAMGKRSKARVVRNLKTRANRFARTTHAAKLRRSIGKGASVAEAGVPQPFHNASLRIERGRRVAPIGPSA